MILIYHPITGCLLIMMLVLLCTALESGRTVIERRCTLNHRPIGWPSGFL